MGEYFGFDIQEREDGVDVAELLSDLDPRYHKAIVIGLHYLSEWYGDKAYGKLDDWFYAIRATVLEMENLFISECDQKLFQTMYGLDPITFKEPAENG